MAKKPPVKCPHCELTFVREDTEFIQVGRRYYHKVCHDLLEAKVSKEKQEQIALEEYIKELFGETYINPRIQKQIKQMKEQYGYSYSGILKSLTYFFEVKKNSVEKANGGIGIVPYIYNEAYDYYYAIYMAQEVNKNKNINEYKANVVEIVIESPKLKPKPKRLFNLEEE